MGVGEAEEHGMRDMEEGTFEMESFPFRTAYCGTLKNG